MLCEKRKAPVRIHSTRPALLSASTARKNLVCESNGIIGRVPKVIRLHGSGGGWIWDDASIIRDWCPRIVPKLMNAKTQRQASVAWKFVSGRCRPQPNHCYSHWDENHSWHNEPKLPFLLLVFSTIGLDWLRISLISSKVFIRHPKLLWQHYLNVMAKLPLILGIELWIIFPNSLLHTATNHQILQQSSSLNWECFKRISNSPAVLNGVFSQPL